jgi:hypothetical protein
MSKMELIKEFWDFAKARKRYWIVPLVVILLLLGILLIFAESSVVAPFIYTLF